jgi:hypothetical protein
MADEKPADEKQAGEKKKRNLKPILVLAAVAAASFLAGFFVLHDTFSPKVTGITAAAGNSSANFTTGDPVLDFLYFDISENESDEGVIFSDEDIIPYW